MSNHEDKLEKFFVEQMVTELPECPVALMVQQLRVAIRQFTKDSENWISILATPALFGQTMLELSPDWCGEIRRILGVWIGRHLLAEHLWNFISGGQDGSADQLVLQPMAWGHSDPSVFWWKPIPGEHGQPIPPPIPPPWSGDTSSCPGSCGNASAHPHCNTPPSIRDPGQPICDNGDRLAGHRHHGNSCGTCPVDVRVKAVMVSCRDCDDIPDAYLVRWQDGIKAWAMFALLKMVNTPWGNVDLSNFYYQRYRDDMNKARIEARGRHYKAHSNGLEPS